MDAPETIEVIQAKETADGLASLSRNEQFVWVIASADFETNLGGATGYL